MKQRERRFVPFDKIEIRAGSNGASILDGHAAVFNVKSAPMWGFVEQIAPGAFTRAIKEDDVRGLFNHDANYVLGRNTAKTLRLSEDDTGLAFEIDIPSTQIIRDLVIAPIERGDITGCSFAFTSDKEEWDFSEDGNDLRTILETSLYDVGPVTFPAYPETDVTARSLEAVAVEGKRILEARRSSVAPYALALKERRLRLTLALEPVRL